MRNREARRKAERETAPPAPARDGWRRSNAPTPTASTPPTPSKSGSTVGADSSNPPSPAAPQRSRLFPASQRVASGAGTGSSWRDREAAKNAASSGGGTAPPSGAASPRRPASPAVVNQPAKDGEGDDGFTTVQAKKWTGSRLRQQKEQHQRQ